MPAVSEASILKAAAALDLEIDADQTHKLLKLKQFIQFYGRTGNLTSKLDDHSLDTQIIEALALVKLARKLDVRGRWLDIGSGGGFPGLVLASCLDVEITLVEPRAKRAGVLELGLRRLGRGDCHVLRGRVDRGHWGPIESGPLASDFDACSARAVFSPERWVLEGGPWLRDGGLLFAHLGADGNVPRGLEECGRVAFRKWMVVGGTVPRGTLPSSS